MSGRLHGAERNAALAAFAARDGTQDGAFVAAVRTTRIYCRPGCPARRPHAANIDFYRTAAAACAAGYRPCKRCLPDDVARGAVAVDRALAMIGAAEGGRVTLDDLAAATGYSPTHFQRLFTRTVGVSPAAYARRLRTGRLEQSLDEEGSVTQAIYAAGYESPGRAFADAGARLGMTPATWRGGGAGERIGFVVADSALGPVLIAATARGICRIAFDEGEADLRARFPAATLVAGDAQLVAMVDGVMAAIAEPARAIDLPLDVRGTAFQQAVWQALRAIPPGETRSYAQLAVAAGRPDAVRAAGSACGANQIAIAIPCHRAVRTDGTLGGYAWGLDRKRALLEGERGSD